MTEIRIDEQPEYIKIIMEDENFKTRIQAISELGTSSYWTDDKRGFLERLRLDIFEGYLNYISHDNQKLIVDLFFKDKDFKCIYDINKFIYDNTSRNEKKELFHYMNNNKQHEYTRLLFKIIFNEYLKGILINEYGILDIMKGTLIERNI